jgi:hypothetical protein
MIIFKKVGGGAFSASAVITHCFSHTWYLWQNKIKINILHYLVAFYKVHSIVRILTALLYKPACLYVYKCAAAIQKLQEKNFILNLAMQRIPSAYWIPDYVATDYPGCRPSKFDIMWLFYICAVIHIAFISPKHHHLPINAVPFLWTLHGESNNHSTIWSILWSTVFETQGVSL